MVNSKNLSLDQLLSLYHMAHFDCGGIACEDCPLFSQEHACGSRRAELIIDQYEKETKQ